MECDGGWGSDGGGGVMEKEVMGEGGVIYALATISMATYHRLRCCVRYSHELFTTSKVR